MPIDWADLSVFVLGGLFGLFLTVIGQVVSARLTREKHLLLASFDKYRGIWTQIEDYEIDDEARRGIIIRNAGDFLERDIEIRLRVTIAEPELSSSIEFSHPQLIDNTASVNTDSPYYLIEKTSSHRIEYLASGQEMRLDMSFGAEILEINFTAASQLSVAVLDWDHENQKELYQNAVNMLEKKLGIDWDRIPVFGHVDEE